MNGVSAALLDAYALAWRLGRLPVYAYDSRVIMPKGIKNIMGNDRKAKNIWFQRVGGINKRFNQLMATGKYKVPSPLAQAESLRH